MITGITDDQIERVVKAVEGIATALHNLSLCVEANNLEEFSFRLGSQVIYLNPGADPVDVEVSLGHPKHNYPIRIKEVKK